MSVSRGGMGRKSGAMFCLVLFALLLVAAPCFAYADDSYTVTIPAEVSVDGSSQQAGLAINGTLGDRQELDISVTSSNNFKLTCGSYSLSYALSGDDYSNGRMRFTSLGGACTFDSALRVSLAGGQTPPVSGVYEDKLTFSYSCSAVRSLSLNANGGTFDSGSGSYVESVKVGSMYGQLPTPGRDGYTFLGWYTSESDGNKIDPSSTTMGECDVALYAQWRPNTLTINYHNDGADRINWDENYISVSKEDVTKFSVDTFGRDFTNGEFGLYDAWRWERAGYRRPQNWTDAKRVAKYNYSKGFTKTEDCADYLGVLDALKKGDVTVDLYPDWVAIEYTVVYDGNGDGVLGATSSSIHTYDVPKALTKNGFSREGYRFAGWNTKQDGTGASYADCAEVKNLTVTNGAKVTLYAQWELISQSESNAADSDSTYVGLVD